MKRRHIFTAMVFVLCTLFATQAFAVEAQGDRTDQAVTQTGEPYLLRADELIGKSVMNNQGENLGTVNDLVIRPDGRVLYAVISRGGVMGIGERLIPVPFTFVSPSAEEGEVRVDVARERFENAPSFSRNEWPEMIDPQQQEQVYGYYGVAAEEGPGTDTYHRDWGGITRMPERSAEEQRRLGTPPELRRPGEEPNPANGGIAPRQ